MTCRIQLLDIPHAGRGRAAHGEAAGRCRVGMDADVSVRPKTTVLLALRGVTLNDFFESRT